MVTGPYSYFLILRFYRGIFDIFFLEILAGIYQHLCLSFRGATIK